MTARRAAEVSMSLAPPPYQHTNELSNFATIGAICCIRLRGMDKIKDKGE